MAAALCSLRDDYVGTGFNTAFRIGDGARHQSNLASRIVGAIDERFQVLFAARPGQGDSRRFFLESCCEAFLVGQEEQEIQRVGLVRMAPHGRSGVVNLLW